MTSRVIREWASAAVAIMITAGGAAGAGQGASAGATQARASQSKPAAQGAKPATPARPATSGRRGAAPARAAAGPVIVVATSRGTFEFETYPQDAPKTVEHIVALVNRKFYNGQRIHRVEPGFVIQFGDPLSRNMARAAQWGTGGSGTPVGVAEIKRKHKLGAVAMAHAGDPKYADSQMYVSLSTAATAQLDGMYTVFGQVISGMDVVQKIRKLDTITTMTVKGVAARGK